VHEVLLRNGGRGGGGHPLAARYNDCRKWVSKFLIWVVGSIRILILFINTH
jgi:hypothetical protein